MFGENREQLTASVCEPDYISIADRLARRLTIRKNAIEALGPLIEYETFDLPQKERQLLFAIYGSLVLSIPKKEADLADAIKQAEKQQDKRD